MTICIVHENFVQCPNCSSDVLLVVSCLLSNYNFTIKRYSKKIYKIDFMSMSACKYFAKVVYSKTTVLLH